MSFVALSDETVVGAILASHDGRRGFIHHLAIDFGYRKQGIARQLVSSSLQVLKDEGIQKCHIFIFNDNSVGIEFWKNIGWNFRSDISVISKAIE